MSQIEVPEEIEHLDFDPEEDGNLTIGLIRATPASTGVGGHPKEEKPLRRERHIPQRKWIVLVV